MDVIEIPGDWRELLERKPGEISKISLNLAKKNQAIVKFVTHALEYCTELLKTMREASEAQQSIIADYLHYLHVGLSNQPTAELGKFSEFLDTNLDIDPEEKEQARGVINNFNVDLITKKSEITDLLHTHKLDELIKKIYELNRKNIDRRKNNENSNNKDNDSHTPCCCKIS